MLKCRQPWVKQAKKLAYFEVREDRMDPDTEKARRIYKESAQRHHDYYVQLFREGKLKPEDQAEYDLAMERERRGEVEALPETEQ